MLKIHLYRIDGWEFIHLKDRGQGIYLISLPFLPLITFEGAIKECKGVFIF